jgi:hypothetical protein
MKINKRKAGVVETMLEYWEGRALLSPEQADTLRGSYEIVGFDWRRLARAAFWVAVSCIVFAVGSALADAEVRRLLRLLFTAPPALKAAGFALSAAAVFVVARRERERSPDHPYRNEAVLTLGVMLVVPAVAYFGQAIDTGSGHGSLLFLLAALVYCAVGVLFPSALVWVFGLVALAGWVGTETGYQTRWGDYWLGMNYPLRMACFGVLVLAFARGIRAWPRAADLAGSTRATGLVYTFVALWVASVAGNTGSMSQWNSVKQIELAGWALLLAGAALVALVLGLRNGDRQAAGFGVTFLLLNVYTQFFALAWDGMYKAVFFAILGASFWLLGTRAERMWASPGQPWWQVFTPRRPQAEPGQTENA